MPLKFLCTWLYHITDNQYMYHMYLFHETSMYFSIFPLFHCWYIFYFLSCKNTKFDWQRNWCILKVYTAVTHLSLSYHLFSLTMMMNGVHCMSRNVDINQKIFWKNSFCNPTLKILVTNNLQRSNIITYMLPTLHFNTLYDNFFSL